MADIPQTVTQMSYSAIIQPYMPVFLVAFIATLILTPLMRRLAHRHGVVDDPDGKRKVHTQPIAYLGGISIFLGWLAGVSVAVFLTPHNAQQSNSPTVQIPPGVVLGAAVVVFFGFLDDVYSLRPRIKLFGQFLAALCLIVTGRLESLSPRLGDLFGHYTDFFLSNAPGRHTGAAWMILDPLLKMGVINEQAVNMHLLHYGAIVFSALVAIFVIIAACNASNLLDGLDGLCSGVTGIMSIGYLMLAVYLAHYTVIAGGGGVYADPTRIALSLALLGAILGFIPYNFNPASIFMGDTGSMFLGYMCGTMIMLFGQYGAIRWFLSAIIIFGLPMMDTFLAIVRRKLNGKPIFSPDSNHFHHFLIRRGMSVRQAVFLSYGVSAVFVSFALVIVIVPTMLAMGIYVVLFGWIVVAAFKMGIVFQNAPQVASNKEINISVIAPTDKAPAIQTPSAIQPPSPPMAPAFLTDKPRREAQEV